MLLLELLWANIFVLAWDSEKPVGLHLVRNAVYRIKMQSNVLKNTLQLSLMLFAGEGCTLQAASGVEVVLKGPQEVQEYKKVRDGAAEFI